MPKKKEVGAGDALTVKDKAPAKSGAGKRGRPSGGKSTDAEKYQQVSMWLTKDSVKKAKHLALDEGKAFSDVIQEALDKHLPKK